MADRFPCLQGIEIAGLVQRGSVELVRSSNECIGDFASTEEAFCCPDFRVTTWALCIDPPFAKLIRVSWFAKVVVMSERSTETGNLIAQFCAQIDSSGNGGNRACGGSTA